MFDQIKAMGQLGPMMAKMRETQAKMAELEAKRGSLRVTGSAGGDAVRATASGDMQIVDLVFSPQAAINDPELLADMTRAAVNQALKNMQEMVQQELQKAAGGLDLSAFKGMLQ